MPGYFPTRPSVHLSDYKRRGPSQPQGAVWSLSKTPLSLLTFLLAARPKTFALVVLFTSRHVHRGRTRVVLVPGVLVDEVQLIIIVVYLFLTLALARARAAVTFNGLFATDFSALGGKQDLSQLMYEADPLNFNN